MVRLSTCHGRMFSGKIIFRNSHFKSNIMDFLSDLEMKQFCNPSLPQCVLD